jgi:hypothetical protein
LESAAAWSTAAESSMRQRGLAGEGLTMRVKRRTGPRIRFLWSR